MQIATLFLAAFVPAVLASVPELAGCLVQTDDKGKLLVKEIIYPINSTFLHAANPLFRKLQRCEWDQLEYRNLLYGQRKQMEGMVKEIEARKKCATKYKKPKPAPKPKVIKPKPTRTTPAHTEPAATVVVTATKTTKSKKPKTTKSAKPKTTKSKKPKTKKPKTKKPKTKKLPTTTLTSTVMVSVETNTSTFVVAARPASGAPNGFYPIQTNSRS